MIVEIIEKVRRKEKLTPIEIHTILNGYLEGEVKDYQMSAFLMAICCNGLSKDEIYSFVDCYIKSGKQLKFPYEKLLVDKHSTGGIGDSTTLVVGPIVASCGVKMAKISGKGLGITGGTIDKLQSIPNFNVCLTKKQFIENLKKVGFVDSSQTDDLVPMDKKVYNLRNNSGTTKSIPLIVSSIMSKKIASGADIILIDIKVGKGALIKTKTDAKLMSDWMKKIGTSYNKKVVTIISDMNKPLSNSIGNLLEVEEAMNVLKGKDCGLLETSREIASILISLAKKITKDEALEEVDYAIKSKKAYKKFLEFVSSQGGDISKIKIDANIKVVRSKETGLLKEIDAEKIGELALKLGAGKINDKEKIDYSAGVKLFKNIGDRVEKNDVLATLYTNKHIILSNDDVNCFIIE